MNFRLQTPFSLNLMTVTLLLFCTLPFACTAGGGDTFRINIHGTLKIKPCHINSDKTIEVTFGNVGVKKIDGQNYMQPVNYSLECDNPNAAATLKMTIKGTQALYDTGAITTTVNGLGIKILQNGSAVVINQAFVIDYNHPPVLQAVPVTSGKALTEGAFSATATLLAEYA